jgi:hypothetical protein
MFHSLQAMSSFSSIFPSNIDDTAYPQLLAINALGLCKYSLLEAPASARGISLAEIPVFIHLSLLAAGKT